MERKLELNKVGATFKDTVDSRYVTPGYYEPPFIVNTTRIPCATSIKNCTFSLLL